MGTIRHVGRAAIWTLGYKSKKPTWVDAYVDGKYCAQILANSIMICRTSRVWRDPLSRLDLTAAMQQQHRPLARPVLLLSSSSTGRWHGRRQTNKQTNKQTSRNDNKAQSRCSYAAANVTQQLNVLCVYCLFDRDADDGGGGSVRSSLNDADSGGSRSTLGLSQRRRTNGRPPSRQTRQWPCTPGKVSIVK